MASSQTSWFKSAVQFGTTAVASATIAALGVVAYIGGDTYQSGTAEITTASGVTVTAGGGRFQVTNLADAACRKDTSGRYYDCYQTATFTNTGASVGTHYYNVASITKPYTGSGIIKLVQVSCDLQPVSTVVSIDQLASTTGCGTTLINKRTIGSGTVIAFSTGSTVWAENKPYVKVSARARVGATQCLLTVISDEAYNP